MDNYYHIKKASRRLRYLCSLIIYIQPVMYALFWVFVNDLLTSPFFPSSMIPFPVSVTPPLPGLSRFLAFCTELIPLGATIFALLKLRQLFGLYEKGEIFTNNNVSCYRGLGRALIVLSLCYVLQRTLLSVALTISNPPGHRMITVGLSSTDFTPVFIGVVILIISWVMDEGRKIQEDQVLII